MRINRQMSMLFLTILLVFGANALPGQSVSQKPANFPKEVSTGNLEADQKANIEAKTKWIKENPETYRAMGGNPEEVLNPQKPATFEKVAAPVYPAFAANEYWQLVSLEAIPAKGMDVTKTELQAESQNVQKDFPLKSTLLQKGNQGKIRMVTGEGKELRATETIEGNQAKWLFEREGCPSCTKTLLLTTTREAGKLIYIMLSEDEGANVSYRFTFTPTTTH